MTLNETWLNSKHNKSRTSDCMATSVWVNDVTSDGIRPNPENRLQENEVSLVSFWQPLPLIKINRPMQKPKLYVPWRGVRNHNLLLNIIFNKPQATGSTKGCFVHYLYLLSLLYIHYYLHVWSFTTQQSFLN